jgi:hypothetical protein
MRPDKNPPAELAKPAGAQRRWGLTLRMLRRLLQRWTVRDRRADGPVIMAGGDAPRDLDDPLSDPKVQARVGEAIARLASRRRPD